MRFASVLKALGLAIVLADVASAAVTMRAGSATVSAPGETADVCVSLDTGGDEVAGTQNDLNWDGSCATLAETGSCFVAGDHGKQLSAATKCGGFCLRAIILSLSDVNPIPDGLLYCCTFTAEAAPGQCCDIAMTNTGTSDPRGHALATNGIGGQLCVAGGGPQTPAVTPTATPQMRGSSSEDDGCQVAPTTNGFGGPLVVAILLGVMRCFVRRRPCPR